MSEQWGREAGREGKERAAERERRIRPLPRHAPDIHSTVARLHRHVSEHGAHLGALEKVDIIGELVVLACNGNHMHIHTRSLGCCSR